MCVVDQSVPRTFPQFMLRGGQGSLVATNTEKLVGKRSIHKQATFVDGSTNKKIQRTCSHEISLFDQLRPGLLGKIGDDAFLHARTERMPSRSFPRLHFYILGETVDDLRLVEQSSILSSTGFWRLSETWCGACGLVPASGVFCQNGSLFPQTLRNLRLASTLKPLHMVIHSGGTLWHSLFAEEPCDCGIKARLGFTNHRTIFAVFAHRIDLCGGRSLRGVAVDLNKLYACHREFLRLRGHLS